MCQALDLSGWMHQLSLCVSVDVPVSIVIVCVSEVGQCGVPGIGVYHCGCTSHHISVSVYRSTDHGVSVWIRIIYNSVSVWMGQVCHSVPIVWIHQVSTCVSVDAPGIMCQCG